jgi:hypothetical protein
MAGAATKQVSTSNRGPAWLGLAWLEQRGAMIESGVAPRGYGQPWLSR